MNTWVKQNNGDYLNPITGHQWVKENDGWQLYEEYGQYKMIFVSNDDFTEIEKKLTGMRNDTTDLRDQFAMAVISGYMATESTLTHESVEWSAKHAYEVADAMLKEREK